MICNRGDVVLVRFPNSDLVTYKKRHALVVQADRDRFLSLSKGRSLSFHNAVNHGGHRITRRPRKKPIR